MKVQALPLLLLALTLEAGVSCSHSPSPQSTARPSAEAEFAVLKVTGFT